MYNKDNELYDDAEVKFKFYKELQEKLGTTLIIQITVEEIKQRCSDLRQAFCKIDNKYLRKENVTYWEIRCISSIRNHYENKTTLHKGNEESSSKFKRKALNNSAASLHHCVILNDPIKSLPTTKLKMIRLQKILRSIEQFSKRQMK
ncbi:uncharacterized protein LOC111694576 [Trichogramma pretiosum]|uniref:uncharacterized protein LOC111694576 n=1 Tax=Trichogramma pretiosum TaxID=7493 RepID=UPI000C71A90A|nr:uncharacterized protein LOC111694576 [Trichogramma pretiosum]